MAALGRILQIVGWLWLIVGFFGPMLGLISLSLLPGIALVFVARVIRNQASKREMPELGEQASEQHQERPDTRAAETSRQRHARPSPEPYVLETPYRPELPPEPELAKPAPAPRRPELLEEVVGTGPDDDDDAGEESSPPLDQATDSQERRPISSGEMLARAHERWGSKRR